MYHLAPGKILFLLQKQLLEIDHNILLVWKDEKLILYYPSLGQHMSVNLDDNSFKLSKFM